MTQSTSQWPEGDWQSLMIQGDYRLGYWQDPPGLQDDLELAWARGERA